MAKVAYNPSGRAGRGAAAGLGELFAAGAAFFAAAAGGVVFFGAGAVCVSIGNGQAMEIANKRTDLRIYENYNGLVRIYRIERGI
jgi:hypothetical protein